MLKKFLKKIDYTFLITVVVIVSIFGIIQETRVWSLDVSYRVAAETALLKKDMTVFITLAVNDLSSLLRSDNLQTVLNASQAQPDSALAREFMLIMKDNGTYDQIRYINADGFEVVRVNNVDGALVAATQDEIQQKGDRYYFQDTMTLDSGEVYVSPMDLNVENFVVEEPYKPLIRVAVPVFNDQGERAGILIVNVKTESLFKKIDIYDESALYSHYMLINSDGYWFYSHDKADEWGFMFKDGANRVFYNAYPDAWSAIRKSDSGRAITTKGVFIFDRIYPVQEANSASDKVASEGQAYNYFSRDLQTRDFYWVLMAHAPLGDLFNGFYHVVFRKYLFLILAMILVAIASRAWHSYRKKRQLQEDA